MSFFRLWGSHSMITKAEVDKLVNHYAQTEGIDYTIHTWDSTQFDDRSAAINYSLVRHLKPKVVVEFGSRTGRCTHDILKALIKNGGEYTFRSYELEDDLRADAQRRIDAIFEDKAITIGGDVTKALDIPDNIDYLFVDNYHDEETTKWLFETLLKKCKPGAIIQIHDIPIKGDFEYGKEGTFPETTLLIDMQKAGTLPLEKLYWTFEEGDGWESTWWVYKPL